MDKNKCRGCGITLVTNDENDIGYINPNNKDGLCQRCYEMINFNKVPDTYLANEEYKKLFKGIVEKGSLIIWVMNIFDFNGSYDKFIKENLKEVPVLIVANKRDILPKSVKDQKLKSWILDYLGKDIKIIDVVVCSAEKNHNIDEILQKVYLLGKKEAYFIGSTNVGKSTLINKLAKSVDKNNNPGLTTSYYSGTTLGIIKVDVAKGLSIYDTPGIINEEQIGQYLTKSSLNIIFPKGELKPTTFQLSNNQTLFVTGMGQIDFIDCNKISVTVYASNRIETHRTNTQNANKIRESHLGNELLQVPNKMEISKLSTFVEHELEINEDCDIFISGLCFVAIKGISKKFKVKVTVLDKISVAIRKNLI